jgi:hypothetical protein
MHYFSECRQNLRVKNVRRLLPVQHVLLRQGLVERGILLGRHRHHLQHVALSAATPPLRHLLLRGQLRHLVIELAV